MKTTHVNAKMQDANNNNRLKAVKISQLINQSTNDSITYCTSYIILLQNVKIINS